MEHVASITTMSWSETKIASNQPQKYLFLQTKTRIRQSFLLKTHTWSCHQRQKPGVPLWGDRSAPVARWAPLGSPTSINFLYLIIQVLADLLQCLVYALEVIVSETPAAALLGVIISVAEYRPPCPHLLTLSVNDAAVNAHAVTTADLVVQYCVLRPADAWNGFLYFPFHCLGVLRWAITRPPC